MSKMLDLLRYGFCTCLFHFAFAADIDLKIHEHSFYSPNGEDGVLAEIFKWIQPSPYFCVDLGAYDGITNSLTYMLRQQGWNSLLLDKSFDIPIFNLHKEFITAENINTLFNKYGVPNHFDLLAIDIGYNDFYIWQAIEERYQPAVVCIAYNAFFKPKEDQIVIYYPYFSGDDTLYFGASMLALYRLGRSKGYMLIYAEEAGQHLFFIREDILNQIEGKFNNINNLNKLYGSIKTQNPFWNKQITPTKREYISSDNALDITNDES